MKPNDLRKKHPKFTYQSFKTSWLDSNLIITSNFTLAPDIVFSPQVTIHGVSTQQFKAIPQQELNLYAFHLGLAEILSYWKCAISPEIIIQAESLSPDQLIFWRNLLFQGLGEFFFVNQLDFTTQNFVKISIIQTPKKTPYLEEKPVSKKSQIAFKITRSSVQKSQIPTQASNFDPQLTGTLVPLGGGKDSLTTLEILKNHQKNNEKTIPAQDKLTLFALNPTQAIKKTLKLNPDLNVITASREIDPKLLKLNQAGYLNGHTPFSSYLAFLSVFVARIFEIKYIAISNERSSNEASTHYQHHPINHQYSKSYQFEKNFQNYIETNFGPNQPQYFSFLRPLYELQIAQIFAKKDLYLNEFKSCNQNQRLDSWCQNCSKCLFAYLILYPFLDEKKMVQIFGINLFSNQSLWNVTLQLIGYSQHKPFDCVGTHEESLIALFLSYQKVKKANKRLSTILENFEKNILPKEKNLTQRAQKILQSWNKDHSLPAQFAKILQSAVESSQRPNSK